MSRKRGRELVALCKNRSDDYNSDAMVSTHGHFNDEPLPYELSRDDPSLGLSECIDAGKSGRIEKLNAVNGCVAMVEVEPLDLIQLNDLISPYEGSSQILTQTENIIHEIDSENNCYGDNIIIEQTEDGNRHVIQVLGSTPDVRVVYIDNPIDCNDNPDIPLDEIQNNSVESERCAVLEPTRTENYAPVHEQEEIQSEQVSSTEKKKSRKRKVNKSEWKFEKMKKARSMGKEYVTVKGKTILEKTICRGILCTNLCRLECSLHFTEAERQLLLDEYYNLSIDAKNAILFKSMRPTPVKRRLVSAQKVRRQTFTYHLKNSKHEEKQVCKRAFMKIFQISVRKVQVIQEKHISGQLLPKADMRGKHNNRPNKVSPEVKDYVMTHIKSFPAEASHYSRNENPNKLYLSPILNIREMYRLYVQKCNAENKESIYHVKECTYRYIFCTEHNLSFGLPRSDVCSRCENENVEVDVHHKVSAKEGYDLMKHDREICKSEEGKLYCTIDIQQTMPLPKMPVGDSFYLRQIWLYNLGIHIASKDKNHAVMCTWTEDVAKKGSFEVSCALHYLAMYLKSTGNNNMIKHLIVWSDSCSGQNKNFNLICQYQYMVLKQHFDVIEHKFPVVGHTYMDSDRDFGRIEKALRKHEKIYTPEEYRDIIKKNSSKNSLVIDMKEHLYDVENVQKELKLINRTKNTLGHKVEFRDEVKWIKIDTFGSYMYKKCYDPNTPFLLVDISRKGTTIRPETVEIQRLTGLRGEVSEEKKNDIRKQLAFIPMEKRFFYERILNN